jgi:hypothetical protein
LLLTLLAVPVFYSLFDDAAETAIVRGLRGRVRGWKTAIVGSFRRRPAESTLNRDEVKEAEPQT